MCGLWLVLAANVASVVASLSTLGQTAGYPLTQSALLVAGILGIVVFKEVKGRKKITCFLICGATLLCGAVLLAMYGACKAA